MQKKNNINLIKQIRKLTKISINKCKIALKKNNFDLKKTLIYLKKKKINNKKKTNEGIIISKIKKNIGIIIKIKCETDFITKNKYFLNFCKKLIKYCLKKKIYNNKNINNYINNKKNFLISKFKENIKIHKIRYLKGKYIIKYIHINYKIGTILKINIKENNNNYYRSAKKICMHITAMNPKYISRKLINKKQIKKEKNSILDYKNKKDLISKLNIKLKKKILLEQNFIFNEKLLVKDYIKKKNIIILKFHRFEI